MQWYDTPGGAVGEAVSRMSRTLRRCSRRISSASRTSSKGASVQVRDGSARSDPQPLGLSRRLAGATRRARRRFGHDQARPRGLSRGDRHRRVRPGAGISSAVDVHVAHQAQREPDGQGISIACRWPIRAVHEIDLHVTPRTADFACAALIAEIEAPAPIGPLVFVNHLPNWQPSFEYERELQTVVAARQIEAMVSEQLLATSSSHGEKTSMPHRMQRRSGSGRGVNHSAA